MHTFHQKVLAVVKKIPKGKVISYAEVARSAGNPRAYRAVGNIMNANRNPAVPCHRVIPSNGTIGGFNRGMKRKMELLRREKAL